jgi:cellulose biosynthesis protein BcsQ
MVPSPVHSDLFVVPGSGEFAHDEKHVGPSQWDGIAQDARQTLIGGVPHDVDIVIIDTPPSLGLWLHCALAAADGYSLLGEAGVLSARGWARSSTRPTRSPRTSTQTSSGSGW